MKDISIEQWYDGPTIIVDDKRFSWGNDDVDLGAGEIKKLLEYLGHKVTLEECY